MQLPVGLGNGGRLEKPVHTGLLRALGCGLPQAFAVDAAIDHDMRHMDALGSELAREALAE